MLVAVISDTHMAAGGRRRLPERCVEQIRAADLLVHAGDIMSLEALAEFEAIGPPVRAITGNMDGWELRDRLPDEAELEIEGAATRGGPRRRAGGRAPRADAAPLPRRRRGRIRPLAHPPARARRRLPDLQPGQPHGAPPSAAPRNGRR